MLFLVCNSLLAILLCYDYYHGARRGSIGHAIAILVHVGLFTPASHSQRRRVECGIVRHRDTSLVATNSIQASARESEAQKAEISHLRDQAVQTYN